MIGLYEDADARIRLPLVFNTYTFNQIIDADANYGILVDRVVVSQSFASTSVPNQDRDGTEIYAARKIAKVISMWGYVKAPSLDKLSDLVDEFVANFDPSLLSFLDTVTNGVSTFSYKNPTDIGPSIDFYNLCRPISAPVILWDRYLGNAIPFRLDLFCPDGRSYRTTSTGVTITGTPSNVINAGNYPTYPVWTINMNTTGAANFQLRNLTATPDETIQLDLSGLSAAAHTVLVYPDQKLILVDGIVNSGIATSLSWFQLPPGIISMDRINSTGITSVTGAFNAAFSL